MLSFSHGHCTLKQKQYLTLVPCCCEHPRAQWQGSQRVGECRYEGL